MAHVFIDDEHGFTTWRDAHPNGFVLNTARNPKPDYLVLHLGACGQLRRTYRGKDVHWTKDFIKICADQRTEIEGWIRTHVAGQPNITICSFCKP